MQYSVVGKEDNVGEGARLVKREVKGREWGMLAVVTEVMEVLPATDMALPYSSLIC